METIMSPYYQYEFTSVEPIIALVSEEFKSYLDTGAIDSSIWPIYVDKCLGKLGKGMLQIQPLMLNICNYEARLPDNFVSVREAWICTNDTSSYQLPGAQYQEVKVQSTSTLLNRVPDTYCTRCDTCSTPDVIKAVYKTTNEIYAYYTQHYLLRPGNIHTKGQCAKGCPNLGSNSTDTFDIHGNKFITNFPTGDVYLLYYSKEVDDNGYQMIPDNYRIKEYIEAFLKQKIYEQLSNQVTDETYNQIEAKAIKYERKADEAFIMASIEDKKETLHKKVNKIAATQNKLNQYRIP